MLQIELQGTLDAHKRDWERLEVAELCTSGRSGDGDSIVEEGAAHAVNETL